MSTTAQGAERGADETEPAAASAPAPARHARVAVICAGIALSMTAAAFAAVPLYRIFCQMTGFGGTAQRVATPSQTMLDRVVSVRFDANVAKGLPWEFEPVQRTMDVRVGENALAVYRVRNNSDRPVKGTAAFNVSPDVVGIHFNKVECFCFTEQTLEPGQSLEMPVSFYIDPAIVKDRDAWARAAQITLSYTFYRTEQQAEGTDARARTGPSAAGKGS